MDFGAVALGGLVMSCSDNHINNNASLFPTTSHSLITNSDPDANPKWYGSVNGGLILKQERSAAATEVDYWRDLKMAKTGGDDVDDLSLSSKPAFLFHNHCTNPSLLLRSNNTSLHSDGQHMLSFSSPSHSQTHFPPHTSTAAAAYLRNTGYGCGGLNAGNMHGMLTGMKGPFTPSQWIELEHQTLIYKYLTANAPIPSHLLPIRKALETVTFTGPHLRHNPYGWGAFQLGFSGSSDPEPGRCRRTDGKKWRCSRDAVVDQKYCERHMNRGRHRSRKPVEGQTGHSASGGGHTASKLMPMSSSIPAAAVATGGASNSLSHLHHHQHLNSMQSDVPNLPASSQLDRGCFVNKANVSDKINENQYSILKQHNPTEESTRSEFGFVCSNSLLNPLHKNTSLINSRNYASFKETKSQNSLRQFMDDWPPSDPTQLSISIPTNDSPLRLSRELDPTQMGLGMGCTIINEAANQRQGNWIPISWETFMGGPLGEVLHSTNSSGGESKNTSPPRTRMALSPTGVLQKTAFGSLSNSSAGSSPRTDQNNLLGSNLSNSSLPAAM